MPLLVNIFSHGGSLSFALLAFGIIVFVCVLLNSASSRVGVPVLLAFILFGIIAGNIDIIPVYLDNYNMAETICTVALIFIMFYGGFGTNWKHARPVALESGLLASVGVVFTAVLVALGCHLLLRWTWMESLLLGSVMSSTDAASVFSSLKSNKLGLKHNTASMLELESGSNDPCSFLMTVVCLSLISSTASAGHIVWMVIKQLLFGTIGGFLIAFAGLRIMRRVHFSGEGFDSIMVFAIALCAYAIPSTIGGNGYLSAYIVGIVMGNSSFPHRKKLAGFFDGVTGLMQVVIFFMLGLLARPSSLLAVVLPSIIIFVVMVLIVRPVVTMSILMPFRKFPWRQQALVSFSGLRGASSIVFAIVAISTASGHIQHDIFSIVFCVVLLSISIQGYLIPFAARHLDMVDDGVDVMQSFTDFADETDLQFSRVLIAEDSSWAGKLVRELKLPKSILVCRIDKPDRTIVPNGNSRIDAGDKVILCSMAFRSEKETMHIIHEEIYAGSPLAGQMIKTHIDRNHNEQVVLMQRGGKYLIPSGSTIMEVGDLLFINKL